MKEIGTLSTDELLIELKQVHNACQSLYIGIGDVQDCFDSRVYVQSSCCA